jgi:hypothetical protein
MTGLKKIVYRQEEAAYRELQDLPAQYSSGGAGLMRRRDSQPPGAAR